MITDTASEVERVLEQFRDGTLTEQALRQALERPPSEARHQDLLYLQATNASVNASLLGMSLVRDGRIVAGPAADEAWPYNSVLEAMRDGWRVIKFPELAMLLVDERTVGLGCEFILEKWS